MCPETDMPHAALGLSQAPDSGALQRSGDGHAACGVRTDFGHLNLLQLIVRRRTCRMRR